MMRFDNAPLPAATKSLVVLGLRSDMLEAYACARLVTFFGIIAFGRTPGSIYLSFPHVPTAATVV